MSSTIGVFIVSRNRLFAEALASLLVRREELCVTGIAPDLTDLPEGSEVLLIDADGDGRNGRDALAGLRRAREHCSSCKPIVLGLALEDEWLIDLIEAGAQGYVLQGTSPAGLVEAIHAVNGGRSGCSPRTAASVVARIVELEGRCTRREPQAGAPLTAREREVLAWMATGRCNKEIGQRLCISVRTVKNHVHSILDKLGARRRREALRTAYDLGLLGEWSAGPAQPLPPRRRD
jgi:DNA-binding NarL/FixJ family response regulator